MFILYIFMIMKRKWTLSLVPFTLKVKLRNNISSKFDMAFLAPKGVQEVQEARCKMTGWQDGKRFYIVLNNNPPRLLTSDQWMNQSVALVKLFQLRQFRLLRIRRLFALNVKEEIYFNKLETSHELFIMKIVRVWFNQTFH